MNDEVSRPITRREIPDDYESPAFFPESVGAVSSGAFMSGSGATMFMLI
jgi:hypothetical protein